MSCATGETCFSLRPRPTAKASTPIRSRRSGIPRPRPKPRPSLRTFWELLVAEMVGPPVVVELVEVWLARIGEDVLDVKDVVEDMDEVVDDEEEMVDDVEDEVVDEDAKEVDMAEALDI